MRKSGSIFASKAERNVFALIEAQVPDGYRLYPNLPLPQIVDVEKTELSPGDWEFYLKTSVDFVVADPEDRPILAIEFDGLSGGFNAGSEYRPAKSTADPGRSRKIDFKLALCAKVDFSLYVISFDEVETLGRDESLRIVHGIVAQHLVRIAMQDKIHHWDQNERGRGKTRNEMEWDRAIAETKLQHRYDPFRFGLDPLWDEFIRLECDWSLEPLSRPDVREVLRTGQIIEAVGVRFTAQRGLRVPVVLTVWVRNFAGRALGTILSPDAAVPNGINPLRVAENAAWYLGVKRTLEVNQPTS